jgi:hypothetical protein
MLTHGASNKYTKSAPMLRVLITINNNHEALYKIDKWGEIMKYIIMLKMVNQIKLIAGDEL